ncbi:thioredoxin-dependent thiol peroxidase [Campylobacter insulaenigrae]|uniref:thioredoxin-dependent peroxiredoxin n=1 Tax=Campylobacter insulaenigrae TaxID=260714 RepID=A0ABY3G5D1_9BACT|nr:thioredoxin-dependent thiol peroxidase [Campylobacter insulaenigrae]MCR6570973.1 thioredoxin-dependent thiol peroxidase [Campylobacter insulaenigrae]MCR6572607.1 thioredoxin-dependent thiol peroxidase [Campylobacter insulaenigrae]MCR6573907.1 thioredoxin-dependent thiol peroxidase [Campylobacter insulaenigrae]MCR6575699.1 thioredoxin-dependent thiol peroxidase [Campylobacter insulaenigrae]MCR6576981.1 thioredoxin-dependent thiol peroxidase [Campylobacter insulaenigrae]
MTELQIGDIAPDFELLNQDGVKISLKDFLGKKIVLYFYPKDNTPGCTLQACDFTKFYDEFLSKNAVIIGISPDSIKSHENFMQKYDLKHILLSDSEKEVCKKYGVWGLKKNYGKEYEGLIRSTFVLDENGIIKNIYKNVKTKEHALKVLNELC